MDLFHRLLHPVKNDTEDDCDCIIHKCLKCPVYTSPDTFIASPPPSPSASHTNLSTALIIIIAILSSFFLIVSYYAIIFKFCARWRNSRVPPAMQELEEEEEEEEEEEIMDPPVNYAWYINTVGLEQSVINSIALCKYKKGEGLIEGTECSVCLCEFRDDEDLRLLPKCSHAFHVNCIDTWLRSHVNCPLCRATIVSNPASTSTNSQVPYESDNPIEIPRENAQNIADLDEHMDGQNLEADVSTEIGREDGRLDVESLNGVSGTSSGVRVLSDLAGNHRMGECALEIIGDRLQPVRRSVSMDSSAAALIYMSLAGMLPSELEGDKKMNLDESSGLKRFGPPIKYGRNRSSVKFIGNGSKGSSFLNRPVAMKRSFSSGGKFFLSRYSRSRNSILPL